MNTDDKEQLDLNSNRFDEYVCCKCHSLQNYSIVQWRLINCCRSDRWTLGEFINYCRRNFGDLDWGEYLEFGVYNGNHRWSVDKEGKIRRTNYCPHHND